MSVLISATASTSLLTALGATPASGDLVYITKGSARFITDMDLTAGGTVDLLGVILGGERSQGVGDQGVRLKIECDQTAAGYLRNQLKGSGQRVMVESFASTRKIAKVHNESAGNVLDIQTALVPQWYNYRGTGLVRGTCDLENLHVERDTVEIESASGVGAVDLIEVGPQGRVICRRDFTNAVIAGRLVIDDDSVTPAAVGNLLVQGVVELRETAATLNMTLKAGSMIDARRITNPVVITTTTYGSPIVLLSKSNPVPVTFTETANGLGLAVEYAP